MSILAALFESKKVKQRLKKAAERARRYVATVNERRVSPGTLAVGALQQFREPMPNEACDPQTVIALLDEIGSPATVATTGGRYFGFVVGGRGPAAAQREVGG